MFVALEASLISLGLHTRSAGETQDLLPLAAQLLGAPWIRHLCSPILTSVLDDLAILIVTPGIAVLLMTASANPSRGPGPGPGPDPINNTSPSPIT